MDTLFNSDLLFPAHCIVEVTTCFLNFVFKSFRERWTGFMPIPSISSSYSLGSIIGTGKWLRTKKISLKKDYRVIVDIGNKNNVHFTGT